MLQLHVATNFESPKAKFGDNTVQSKVALSAHITNVDLHVHVTHTPSLLLRNLHKGINVRLGVSPGKDPGEIYPTNKRDIVEINTYSKVAASPCLAKATQATNTVNKSIC